MNPESLKPIASIPALSRRTVLIGIAGATGAGIALFTGGAPAFASNAPSVTPMEAPVGVPSFDATALATDIPAPPATWPASELQNAQKWLEQQAAIAQRMQTGGYQYRYTPYWLYPEDYDFSTAPKEDRRSKRMLALLGQETRPEKSTYDWRTAGHHGAVVHATGMDTAN